MPSALTTAFRTVLLQPTRNLIEALRGRRRTRRERELDEDVRNSLNNNNFEGVKLALERGGAFPSPLELPDLHLKVWNLIVEKDAVDYFCDLRRSKMTAADKALEADFLSACQRDAQGEIKRLHDQGADLIASALLSPESAQVALRSAVTCGLTRIVQFHAHRPDPRQGPNQYFADVNSVDQHGKSVLMYASQCDDEATVKILLERGDILVNLGDHDGQTALMHASRGSQGSIVVKPLLERDDLQVNLADSDGRTALMHASRGGSKDMVKALLERDDIQVNLVDSDGDTALMNALSTMHRAPADLLLERPDIDLSIVNRRGETAYMIALRMGFADIAERILEGCPSSQT